MTYQIKVFFQKTKRDLLDEIQQLLKSLKAVVT